jgi:hypothetical protein
VTEFADLCAGPGERHLVIATSRAGKSGVVEWEARHVQATRPDAMQALTDTKPRFRAETERNPINPKWRKSAAWRYESWQKGPTVPNSVLVDLYSPHPFRGLWERPGEIAILQSGDERDWRRMLVLLEAFCKANIKGRERRLIADEVLDFYGRNTFSIMQKHDIFYRMSRAGGERAIGTTLGAHYVKGIPPLVRKMASRVTLGQIDEDDDIRQLRSCGIRDACSPPERFSFRQWRKENGGRMSAPVDFVCEYPDSYLAQLAAT